jgi:uncharacterized membrane protein YraQ (UPF0718 family)
VFFYAVAAAGLIVSVVADRARTAAALRKAWSSFVGILPQFVAVIIIAGMILAALDADTISRLAGARSGWLGVVGAALVGSVTLIPGFIAFPLAALLVNNGAGWSQDRPCPQPCRPGLFVRRGPGAGPGGPYARRAADGAARPPGPHA